MHFKIYMYLIGKQQVYSENLRKTASHSFTAQLIRFSPLFRMWKFGIPVEMVVSFNASHPVYHSYDSEITSGIE